MLLRINFNTFLADERKQAVMQMARRKLHHSTDDTLIKVFELMCELDKESHILNLVT